MKNPNRKTISHLEELPNVGKVTAANLALIGITDPKHLLGRNGPELYENLCSATKTRIDPCVCDIFMSIVDFMEGGEPKPWWEFTSKRKQIFTTPD